MSLTGSRSIASRRSCQGMAIDMAVRRQLEGGRWHGSCKLQWAMVSRTLVSLLPAISLVLLVGCELPDKDVAGDEEMIRSHEGEPCGEDDVLIQPCSDADGELGEEICYPADYGEEQLWSACQVETCGEVEDQQSCEREDGAGVQYCYETSTESLRWGPCVSENACVVGMSYECGFMDWTVDCFLDVNGIPTLEEYGCDTPLVLSFDGQAPAFVAPPMAAAAFDISGVGACTDPDWPTAATPWLAMDRDQSGSIEAGAELFGSGTRLASGSRAKQGFEALSELDSDHDGRITPADSAWSELVLWADHDGDRRSTNWELLPLESYGVLSIELDYRQELECDERGNCGKERASFTFRDGGQARSGEVVDVYLTCGE